MTRKALAELAGRGLNDIPSLSTEQFCYLTTKGRRTGNAHTIEIWFAMLSGAHTMYMLAGGGERSDWVKNILNDPIVKVTIGKQEFKGQGRIVQEAEEERTARKLVVAKYYGRPQVRSTGWEAIALPVAVDLQL